MSLSGDASSNGATKKPSDSAFKQQKLPAWQPILTAGTVLPTFFVIGIAFIPVGIGLLYFSDEVKEFVLDYTDCKQTVWNSGSKSWSVKDQTCLDVIKASNADDTECFCREQIELKEDFQGNVFMYYGLTNFYQNHRRYVKSRDDNQLLGNLYAEPSHDCMPFDYFVYENKTKLPIAPCGAIANSMFNDVLTLSTKNNGDTWEDVPLINTGIAWDSDKNIKFRNPPGNLTEAFKGFAKPKAWKKPIYELDLKNEHNNGFQNEDFIVWMRTAALPNFRKLYRRLNHSEKSYANGLKKGTYLLTIEYNYDVSTFYGRKQMILSTTSLLGGKNPFLGIAYIVVGVVCLILGIALLLIHIKCGRGTSEMINVNPRTPYQ